MSTPSPKKKRELLLGNYNVSVTNVQNFSNLQIEGSLFKVPRYHFENSSEVFHDMFLLPQGDSPEGSSDDHPIKLEGVLAYDFEQLLGTLYPGVAPSAETIDWKSVLKLATLWRFLNIRKLAIQHLASKSNFDKMSAHEKLSLGQKYHVVEWVRRGYIQFITRKKPLTVEEGENIGLSAAIRLFRLREKVWKKYMSKQLEDDDCFTVAGSKPASTKRVRAAVNREFEEELKDAEFKARALLPEENRQKSTGSVRSNPPKIRHSSD
ncbi:hypothetical protein D9758_014346 [Tetrapyrgos nigripes]|uniref:BTB domain-containing protein n=1 Tax=Tetrapyrgos nigripes TaxID=182062 RepID=A0A8H5FGZ4_9AGAR|nr:hypothetical protein D9758_014346 [Tetrapyrgos nigripes]